MLSPIRRNTYKEPDRAAVQDRVADAVEKDPAAFLDAYRNHPASQQGRYICSDAVKEIFPDFAASPESRARYNSVVHNSAAVLAAAQLESVLTDSSDPKRDTVIFLTGVPGAGKTSSVVKSGKIDDHIRAVYEGQLAEPLAAIDKIQQAVDQGLKIQIVAVHTAPEFALQNTLSRFEREGRGASIHAMATIQSKLPEGLEAIREVFGDRVALTVLDRTAGPNNTIEHRGWDKISILQKEGSYDNIRTRLIHALEQHREAGTISEDGYKQAAGLAPSTPARPANYEDARRTEQLSPRLDEPASRIERYGALRFWKEQDTAAGVTVKYAAGRLDLHEGRVPRDLAAQRAVSKGTGYDAGHIIGHQFGGPEIAANLSLQNHAMNQGGGTYFQQEQRWADELRAGNAVAVNIREVSKNDVSAAFLHRDVNAVITRPNGEVFKETIAFLNPESERVRQVTGKVIPTLDKPATITRLDDRRARGADARSRPAKDDGDRER